MPNKRGSLSNAVKKPTPPAYRDKPSQEFIPAEATTDEERLQQLENTILECSRVFAMMGKALREINESRLYRIKGFETFDEYCLQEWDISGRRAYQMIDAAKVMENMQGCQQLPSNESQARALVKLPPEKQREVWEAVVKDAPKPHKITAKDLEERAKAYQDPQEQAKNYLADSMEEPQPTQANPQQPTADGTQGSPQDKPAARQPQTNAKPKETTDTPQPDDITPPLSHKASEVVELIGKGNWIEPLCLEHYPFIKEMKTPPAFKLFSEVTVRIPTDEKTRFDKEKPQRRRFDVVCIIKPHYKAWGNELLTVGLEIKVSKGDLKGDLKFGDYLGYTDFFLFAVPSNLVDDAVAKAEQSVQIGVLDVDKQEIVKWPVRQDVEATNGFEIMREMLFKGI